jgi:hypothetical protein
MNILLVPFYLIFSYYLVVVANAGESLALSAYFEFFNSSNCKKQDAGIRVAQWIGRQNECLNLTEVALEAGFHYRPHAGHQHFLWFHCGASGYLREEKLITYSTKECKGKRAVYRHGKCFDSHPHNSGYVTVCCSITKYFGDRNWEVCV